MKTTLQIIHNTFKTWVYRWMFYVGRKLKACVLGELNYKTRLYNKKLSSDTSFIETHL